MNCTFTGNRAGGSADANRVGGSADENLADDDDQQGAEEEEEEEGNAVLPRKGRKRKQGHGHGGALAAIASSPLLTGCSFSNNTAVAELPTSSGGGEFYFT